MKIHFIVHESYEAPGAFEKWVGDHGHEAYYSRVYAGDALPTDIDGIDFLIVLGGPQSPSTSVEECPHFDANAECALILACINAGKAVIGVCLGAQLIGVALGAGHDQSPEKEIGKFPISLTEEGRVNPKFSHFNRTELVGHWHSDMPGLTPTSRVLAISEGCPRQIIEYSDLVYGFQCHLELTQEVVALLIAASEHDLLRLKSHRFVQQPEALRSHDYSVMNHLLFGFLNKLMVSYLAGEIRLSALG